MMGKNSNRWIVVTRDNMIVHIVFNFYVSGEIGGDDLVNITDGLVVKSSSTVCVCGLAVVSDPVLEVEENLVLVCRILVGSVATLVLLSIIRIPGETW